MKNGCLYVFLLSILLFAGTAAGQNFPMLHYTVENGLPSNKVYNVMKDRQNYLWFCTDKGLVRYDGIVFEKFTTNDGLPDNDIFFTKEDNEGRLWINCYNGSLCFYKDGIFHTAENTPFLQLPFKPSFLNYIEVEKDSSLTFSFKNFSYALNIHHNTATCFPLNNPAFSEANIGEIYYAGKISADRYFLAASYASFIVDTACNIIKWKKNRGSGRYHPAFGTLERFLWNSDGLYSVDSCDTLVFAFTNKTLQQSNVLKVSTEGNMRFIATNSGFFINNKDRVLDGNRISSLCTDEEGNHWATSLDDGVYCFGRDFKSVNEYDNTYKGKALFAQANGDHLFYNAGARDFYRLQDGKPRLIVDFYKSFRKRFATELSWDQFVNFSNDFGALIDDSGNYYCFSRNISFILHGINSGRPQMHVYRLNDSLESAKQMIIKDGHIIIRSSYWIFELVHRQPHDDILRFVPRSDYKPARRIFGMSADDNSAVWYSSQFSVIKNIGDSTIVQPQFGSSTFKWMNIVHNYLVGISNKNQLVVCNNFDKKNISIKTFEKQDCIWDKLYRLNDSAFLVSTDRQYRLLHLYPSPDSARASLQVIENAFLPVQPEFTCSNDSFCYFFKGGSIFKVPLNQLFVNHLPPRIIFKTLRTRNENYPITEGMEIKYKESKNITITFRPFSFGSKDIICQYSISNGSADDWRLVHNNEINLFDPGYGSYVVKVRARTLSGDFCTPYAFSFTILRPVWATWWFIALALAGAAVAATLGIRAIFAQRIRKRELRHANEIRFLRSEYRALNALMNPHFIFNTLNNVQWLVSNGDNKAANQYLKVFSNLVRQNMHNISKELIPLSSEVELIKNYLTLEKLRFKNALNYEIQIEDELLLDDIEIPPLLIQPLVENAIKHGLLPRMDAHNLLVVSIYRREELLFVDIRDSGIGLSESRKNPRLHQSTGIENIKTRIAKLSLMHDILISLSIEELRNAAGETEGTLARICIDVHEE